MVSINDLIEVEYTILREQIKEKEIMQLLELQI